MKIALLLIIVASLFSSTYAQEKIPGKQFHFKSLNQIGLQNGDAGVSYDLQTINGIAFKKYSAGLGIGIDNYINRSVPIFLRLQREFTNQTNRPFIYGGAGLNFNWLTEQQKEQKGSSYSTTPGLYADAGLGYKMKTKGNVAFLLSAGYSYKQSKEVVASWASILPWPMPDQPSEPAREKINSQYRRIVIRFGLEF